MLTVEKFERKTIFIIILNAVNFILQSNFGFDIGMLVVLLVGYRLLAFIFLYIKFYRRKSD